MSKLIGLMLFTYLSFVVNDTFPNLYTDTLVVIMCIATSWLVVKDLIVRFKKG